MTKEEAIEHIKLIRFNAALTNANAFRDALDMAIEALSHPSLPSNLDEAAEEYKEEFGKYLYGISTAFKAGAEWMAGQGVSEEFDVEDGVSKIQPIPLTAEILEKNGFKIVHGFGYSESYPTYGWGYHKGLRDYASVDVTFYDEPIGGVSRLVKMETASKKDDGINSIHSCDIEFIHQLQHALKLAGIEKEITI